MKRFALLFQLLLPLAFSLQAQTVTVVAASNIKPALDSICIRFRLLHPEYKTTLIYGSSGKLFEQIKNGAPFDLFLSADMAYPEQLIKNGNASGPVKRYATGQLALWSKKINVAILKEKSLNDTGIKKIAIANPATAPYGQKAVECMKYYKLYEAQQSKLVYGENIAQAAQFVSVGGAEIGVLALSEVLSPSLKKENGYYYILPEKSYSSLEQGCVQLKHGAGNKAAKELFDFLSSPEAVKILQYYGYKINSKS